MAISAAPPLPGRRTAGLGVVADHGGVDVAVAVNLGAAEEAHLDTAILKEALKDIGHAADHERAGDQGRIPDRDRQPFRHRTYGAGLIDQHQVGRMGLAGEVAGEVGQPDPDEDDFAVPQLPGGDGSHHLAGTVCQFHNRHLMEND